MNRRGRIPLALILLCLTSSGCGQGAGASGALSDLLIIGGPGQGDGCFHEPRAIEALPDESCVVIDRSGRIQQFGPHGKLQLCWWLPAWKKGCPVDLTLTPWNTFIVSDTHYNMLLEYDRQGKLLRRMGEGSGLELVRGVVASKSTIYVASYGEHDRIMEFDRGGHLTGTFGSPGDGPGQFRRPEGIAFGSSGDLFVVDCGHHRVERFTTAGKFVSSFGKPGQKPGQLLFPFDIAAGSDATLYVVDFQGNRVQRFSEDGRFLGVVGGAGREPGRFATPRGIAVLPEKSGDLIFVADTNNHRVQRFRWDQKP